MTAADPWPEDRRPRVIDALTDMTLALQALPVDECPFDRSLANRRPGGGLVPAECSPGSGDGEGRRPA
jgi:hypothetical protein